MCSSDLLDLLFLWLGNIVPRCAFGKNCFHVFFSLVSSKSNHSCISLSTSFTIDWLISDSLGASLCLYALLCPKTTPSRMHCSSNCMNFGVIYSSLRRSSSFVRLASSSCHHHSLLATRTPNPCAHNLNVAFAQQSLVTGCNRGIEIGRAHV